MSQLQVMYCTLFISCFVDKDQGNTCVTFSIARAVRPILMAVGNLLMGGPSYSWLDIVEIVRNVLQTVSKCEHILKICCQL